MTTNKILALAVVAYVYGAALTTLPQNVNKIVGCYNEVMVQYYLHAVLFMKLSQCECEQLTYV